MTNKEAVNWIINLMADIGKAEHSELWHYEQALKEIKEMLESEFRWIPVSERLPEKEDEVLVTTSWNNVCMAWCDNEKWRAEYINGYDDDEILAWMPLPEPYKGDEL